MKTTDPEFESTLRAAAEKWVGTSFRRLHCEMNVGVDCANITYAVLSDSGLQLPEMRAPTFGKTVDQSFDNIISEFLADFVKSEAFTILDDLDNPDIRPGDILLFRVTKAMQHLTAAVSATEQLSVWPSRPAAIIAIDAKWRRRLIGHYRYA
ncbi:MAG: hypothetical protein JW739_05630 [Opitutales bacterium]|nr:hypothetical protein [Opitutales bacterium]